MQVVLILLLTISLSTTDHTNCGQYCTCETLEEVSSITVKTRVVTITNKENVKAVECDHETHNQQVNFSHLFEAHVVGKLGSFSGTALPIQENLLSHARDLTQLYVRNAKLSGVPPQFFNISNDIQVVDLSMNLITNIEFISRAQFGTLKVLNLHHNSISSLDTETATRLESLVVLIVSNNLITTSAPLALYTFPNLKTLDLSYNHVDELPRESFSRCGSVELLDLSNNRLEQVQKESFQNMTSLLKLKLNCNNLAHVPADLLHTMSALELINLSHNRLTTFQYARTPSSTSLKHLMLGSNKIKEITKSMSESFKGLDSLECIHLENNNISYLESLTFADLPKLKMLVLSMNPLTGMDTNALSNLPSLDSILFTRNLVPLVLDINKSQKFKSFTDLKLINAKIYDIKSSLLDGFPNILTLDLHKNRLENLEFLRGEEDAALEIINLSNNRIKQIDDKTIPSTLKNVVHLDVHSNRLPFIDLSYFEPLSKLEFLDLSDNKLTKITAIKAKTTEMLQQLKHLNLSRNLVTSLDYFRNINFISLMSVNISNCNLNTLPDCFFADAHIPDQLSSVDYSTNSIVCNCANAWLREINVRVDEVNPSKCAGISYVSDTFPVAECEPEDLQKLNKLQCEATNTKPNVEVLYVFGMANLFLMTVIVGGYLKKKFCGPAARSQQTSIKISEKLRYGLAKNQDGARNAKFPWKDAVPSEQQATQRSYPGSGGVTDRKNSLGWSAKGSVQNLQSKPSSRRGKLIANNLKADALAHADLMRKLLKMEQADYDLHSSPQKSVHASYDNLLAETDVHQVFLSRMKKSQSADDIQTSFHDLEPKDRSTVLKVVDIKPTKSERSERVEKPPERMENPANSKLGGKETKDNRPPQDNLLRVIPFPTTGQENRSRALLEAIVEHQERGTDGLTVQRHTDFTSSDESKSQEKIRIVIPE